MSNDVMLMILEIVVSAIAIVVARYAIPYVKTLTDSAKYNELVDIIVVAVRSAEQTIRESGQGKVKKAQVLAFVSAWLSERGIHITEEELDRLIECAVYQMKKEV